MSTHLRPTAPIAADALLPGDPGRALALAQDLFESPLMSNHHRGLWGYAGETALGHRLTIQATGIGGPSLAVVVEELAAAGVVRAIRLGTCEALDGELAVGSLLIVGAAIPDDGASRALGAAGVLHPDAAITAALLAAAGRQAIETTVASHDLYYDPEAGRRRAGWLAAGARAADLGTAPLLALGSRLGVAVGCGLVVAGGSGGGALDDERLAAASARLGRLAAEALAAQPESAPEAVEPS